jgi:coenzyme F420-reducing hydrogenase beta subunit
MEKKTIRLFDEPHQCSGCGACLVVCPKQAIRMTERKYGCKYPVIDEDACVGCGKCERVCAYQSPRVGQQPAAAYAAVGENAELVSRSASGGIFASLAMRWICEGGLVAGAVMDVQDNMQVYHLLSDKAEDIRRM